MKVLLVAVNAKFIHSNLAIKYLNAFTEDLNYECINREFTINDRVDRVIEKIISEKPDIVGFSCYIWNIEFVLKLANLIKAINTNIEILYGGPEVSYDCKKFLEYNPGEYIIQGEGEETYREFIQYKLGLKTIESIKGLHYIDNKRISFNGERCLMDLNQMVFPYYPSDSIEDEMVYYEASRGCPFCCIFCLSSTTHGVRGVNIEKVKKQLDFFVKKNVKLVKFVDRTFNFNEAFAYELWDYLIKLNCKTCFHFEISADILSERQIELLKTAPKGRFQFEIGVQTTNDMVLKNINRKAGFLNLKEKVKLLRSYNNIHLHLDLIAGLPGEDIQSFKDSFNEVYSLAPNQLQLGFLKLLKGSPMRQEALKWGMRYSPYAPYEILMSSDISYEELVQLKKIEEIVDKYYNSEKFNLILGYFENKFLSPFDFYESFSKFFSFKGYFDRNISATEYYKVFIDFNEEILKENSDVLKEIIKYEFLKNNKKKWVPDFLPKDYIKTTKNIHIERFTFDIEEYSKSGEIVEGDFNVEFKSEL